MIVAPRDGELAILKCVDPLKDSKDYIIPTGEECTITISVTYNIKKVTTCVVPFSREKTTQPFGLCKWYEMT